MGFNLWKLEMSDDNEIFDVTRRDAKEKKVECEGRCAKLSSLGLEEGD